MNEMNDAISELRKSEKFREWGKPRLPGIEQSNIMKEKHYAPDELAELRGESPPKPFASIFREEPGVLKLWQDRFQVQARVRHAANPRRRCGACSRAVSLMLNVYRRHSPSCPHQSREYNRCRCRIWYDWNIDGKRITKPIGTRDWQRAQQLAREMEQRSGVMTEPERQNRQPRESLRRFSGGRQGERTSGAVPIQVQAAAYAIEGVCRCEGFDVYFSFRSG